MGGGGGGVVMVMVIIVVVVVVVGLLSALGENTRRVIYSQKLSYF